ncbi:hypothetical protein [Halorubrum sp. HHNYT27]|uniref:hypothetical protein n=1 Tax=Halorubrum sp. HHNYT27 TaxID=3402275 RepID=UPI003EBBB1BC
MLRSLRFGHVLVVLGVGIALLSVWTGGATDRGCPIDGVAYDLVGIHLAGASVTEIDLAAGTLEWYDGCNWHTNSLVPVAVGGVVSTAGVLALWLNGAAVPETKE